MDRSRDFYSYDSTTFSCGDGAPSFVPAAAGAENVGNAAEMDSKGSFGIPLFDDMFQQQGSELSTEKVNAVDVTEEATKHQVTKNFASRAAAEQAFIGPLSKLNVPNDDWKAVSADFPHYHQRIFDALKSASAPPKDTWPKHRKESYHSGQEKAATAISNLTSTSERCQRVDAACAISIHKIIGFHRVGVPRRAFDDPKELNRGTEPDTALTCSERMELVIEIVKKNKLSALDLIKADSSTEVLLLNPAKSLQAKIGNTVTNSNKGLRLKLYAQHADEEKQQQGGEQTTPKSRTRRQKQSLPVTPLKESTGVDSPMTGSMGLGSFDRTSITPSTGRGPESVKRRARKRANLRSNFPVEDESEPSTPMELPTKSTRKRKGQQAFDEDTELPSSTAFTTPAPYPCQPPLNAQFETPTLSDDPFWNQPRNSFYPPQITSNPGYPTYPAPYAPSPQLPYQLSPQPAYAASEQRIGYSTRPFQNQSGTFGGHEYVYGMYQGTGGDYVGGGSWGYEGAELIGGYGEIYQNPDGSCDGGAGPTYSENTDWRLGGAGI